MAKQLDLIPRADYENAEEQTMLSLMFVKKMRD